MKYNWQQASAELRSYMYSICRGAQGVGGGGGGVTSYAWGTNIMLVDFNLTVSIPTAKPPNFNSLSNLPAIR